MNCASDPLIPPSPASSSIAPVRARPRPSVRGAAQRRRPCRRPPGARQAARRRHQRAAGAAEAEQAERNGDYGKVAEKPLMNAQEWQQWVAAGMDVGSHTRWHRDLPTLSSEDALSEITLSKSELAQQIGCEVRHFCYPYGHYSPEHVQMVKAAGYQTATTTRRGRVNVGDDLLELRRVMVARATHPLQFYMKIATAYEDRRA